MKDYEKMNTMVLIEKRSRERGFKVKYLDPPRRKMLSVSNGKSVFVSSSQTSYQVGMYPNNQFQFYGLFKDKAWTKKLLKKHGFKVTPGRHFYTDRDWGKKGSPYSWHKSFDYAESLGYPIFIKPNRGTQGKFCSVIFNKTQLLKHIREMKSYCSVFLIEKARKKPEYRIYVLNGRPMFSYKKNRQVIMGDGKSTIMQLLESLHIPLSPFVASNIKAKKKSLRSVLSVDEQLDASPVANITQGADISHYNEKFSGDLINWCKQVHTLFPNQVIGIDLFSNSNLQDVKEFEIIELNLQPSLVGIYDHGEKKMVNTIIDIILDNFFATKK